MIKLSENEAKEKLKKDARFEDDATIKETLYLYGWKEDELILGGSIVYSNDLIIDTASIGMIDLTGAIIEGNLEILCTSIKYDLELTNATIAGELDLEGTSFGGDLYLCGIKVYGTINLNTESGPRKIFVSPDMAELVHWSAPTIPLVVVK
ncbi:hypothetical protein EPN15_04405 [Patescibacteria group bacterium]|nr:MAG: hypothetical protein EPN15_04405 [Patescibacteria group bacterium]